MRKRAHRWCENDPAGRLMSARRSPHSVRCTKGYGLWKAQLATQECTMIDWDDVRYFLAVARGGSVRAAAERLGVNHSTVLRRIARLEERLGAHMFEKLPSGYRLTAGGRGGPRAREPDGSVIAPAGDARLRARPERARASAGDAGADPRDTPAHAGLRRFRASASGHRDGNLVVRRAGESDQPRGRRGDPRRLRPQNPAAQSSRPEGTGAVRRRLHVPRSTSRVACGRA